MVVKQFLANFSSTVVWSNWCSTHGKFYIKKDSLQSWENRCTEDRRGYFLLPYDISFLYSLVQYLENRLNHRPLHTSDLLPHNQDDTSKKNETKSVPEKAQFKKWPWLKKLN